MKKPSLLRKINVTIQYILFSLEQVNKPKIGDVVLYNGVECRLVTRVSGNCWDLSPQTKENLVRSQRIIHKLVDVDDFHMQSLIKRFFFSFLFTYKFLMSNWYLIDISKNGEMSYRRVRLGTSGNTKTRDLES